MPSSDISPLVPDLNFIIYVLISLLNIDCIKVKR